ncbi:MAG TPA: thiamine biosynthesis protein ApbE [Porphyromonadaceae bacterium]|nr:thiamine biosynthesis protein ApbE [Porphyromonadaceae bacterium]
MKNKKIFWIYMLFILFLLGMFFKGLGKRKQFYTDEGKIFGTYYHITYQHTSPLTKEIGEELQRFDKSLSTFNPESTISRVNANDTSVEIDAWFKKVFEKSIEVSNATKGAFDITVAPLVNAWGFGFKKREQVTKKLIDSLMPLVGYKKVVLCNGKVIKDNPNIMLDCSAIAKGYACDVIGEMLEKKGVKNFMVEIGGEVFCKGSKANGEMWNIGISNPIEMGQEGGNVEDIQNVISLSNKGLATSGNYRNFYYEGGKRYAHTIDPHTGFPVQHTLLSATVIAPECIIADAYATAFMVLGEERSMKIVQSNPDLEAYFISASVEGDTFLISYSAGIEGMLRRK